MLDFELSELDSIRATIPNGSRLESPILVRVNEVQQTPLSDNAPVVKVNDRNQNPFDINVWDTHEVTVDWKVDRWYVVAGARGRVWKTSADDVKHRLSSTPDFRVDTLDRDIDPEPVDNQPENSTEAATEYNQRNMPGRVKRDDECQQIETNSRDAEDILEETEEGSVTDEIVSDFEL